MNGNEDMVTDVMGPEVKEDDTEQVSDEQTETEQTGTEQAETEQTETEQTETEQTETEQAGTEQAETEQTEAEQAKQQTEAELAQQALDDIDRSSPAYKGLIRDLQAERAKRHEAEQALEERLAKVEQGSAQQATEVKPVTIGQLRDKYELTQEETPTIAMLEELETNQHAQTSQQATAQTAKTQKDQAATVEQAYRQAEVTLVQEIGTEAEVVGLGYAQVVTAENIQYLNGLDWQEIGAKPAEQRPKLTYEKIIAKHPQLKDKNAAYQSTKKKPSQPDGTHVTPKVPVKKPKGPAANTAGANFTQEDLLEGNVDLATQLYGPAEVEKEPGQT